MLINTGIKRLVRETRVPSTATLYTTDGVGAYTLPNSVQERGDALVMSVRCGGYPIEYRCPTTIADTTYAGDPRYYFTDAVGIYLYPVPSVTGTPIEVSYVAVLPRLSNPSDTTPLDDEQIEAVVLYAVWQMKAKDDEYNTYDRRRNEYEAAIERLSMTPAGVY